mmetsp:Transcript_124341/g.398149  ORF Transcript_124341/g.398149 Transcript_124341/m.398149 type:complete len:261 (+) Transcript_124341:209-991(+)
MGSARAAIFFAIAAFVLATSLQGCGNKPAPTPTPTPPPSPPTTTTTTTTTTASSEWTLPPIEVKGSHLYDSKTGKEFRAKGIGMPNSGEDVKEWIAVLQRIKSIASSLNVVRLYELPTCALVSDCFKGFMLEADKLGVYVLAPGTGTTWGWLPGSASACTPATADGCYKAGAVLGWGQTIIQRFNYPNTLAIVMGLRSGSQGPHEDVQHQRCVSHERPDEEHPVDVRLFGRQRKRRCLPKGGLHVLRHGGHICRHFRFEC